MSYVNVVPDALAAAAADVSAIGSSLNAAHAAAAFRPPRWRPPVLMRCRLRHVGVFPVRHGISSVWHRGGGVWGPVRAGANSGRGRVFGRRDECYGCSSGRLGEPHVRYFVSFDWYFGSFD